MVLQLFTGNFSFVARARVGWNKGDYKKYNSPTKKFQGDAQATGNQRGFLRGERANKLTQKIKKSILAGPDD